MADTARYSAYDANGNVIVTFIGEGGLIENSMKFGKLTQSERNEMMLVIGDNGMELSQWNFSPGFKIYLRPQWMLVKHVS